MNSLRDSILLAKEVYSAYDENADIAEALTEMVSKSFGLKPGYQMLRIFTMIIGVRTVPETNQATDLVVAGG